VGTVTFVTFRTGAAFGAAIGLARAVGTAFLAETLARLAGGSEAFRSIVTRASSPCESARR
jgi:hypothetical protein